MPQCSNLFDGKWRVDYIDEEDYSAIMDISLSSTAGTQIRGTIERNGIPDGSFIGDEVSCIEDGFLLQFRYKLGSGHTGRMGLVVFADSPDLITGEYKDDGAGGDEGFVEMVRI